METRRQLLLYVVIGLASNSALYVGYLTVTTLGLGHKTAMTVLFVTGIIGTYFLNRGLTFRHGGSVLESAPRYASAYLLAYVGNVAALFWLVDVEHFPHRIVMLGLIPVTACVLFLLQKFWVFHGTRARPNHARVSS